MAEQQKANEKYKVDEIITAIKGSSGIKANIMRRLGCDRHTVDNYLKRYATAQAAYDEELQMPLDAAESLVVNDMVTNRNVETAKWYLKAKGKIRGYNEQAELKHSGSLDLKVVKGYMEVMPDDWDAKQDTTDSHL